MAYRSNWSIGILAIKHKVKPWGIGALPVSTVKKRGIQLVKLDGLDKVPSGYWAAVVNGKSRGMG
ncbi:MAG: hypothetical protein DRO18_00390 [Thermoprotei archaeon]|nr:MAG: hypothetical protein DRO18_00390 [Thermoprotei archaeon]